MINSTHEQMACSLARNHAGLRNFLSVVKKLHENEKNVLLLTEPTLHMLSHKEREGCKSILNKLPQQDLINLTDTVTNRVVSPENTTGKVLQVFRFCVYILVDVLACYITEYVYELCRILTRMSENTNKANEYSAMLHTKTTNK